VRHAPSASTETGCQAFQVARRDSWSAVAISIGALPKQIRSGGSPASTTSRVAPRVAAGSPGLIAEAAFVATAVGLATWRGTETLCRRRSRKLS
jgi:hypothetical protein